MPKIESSPTRSTSSPLPQRSSYTSIHTTQKITNTVHLFNTMPLFLPPKNSNLALSFLHIRHGWDKRHQEGCLLRTISQVLNHPRTIIQANTLTLGGTSAFQIAREGPKREREELSISCFEKNITWEDSQQPQNPYSSIHPRWNHTFSKTANNSLNPHLLII